MSSPHSFQLLRQRWHRLWVERLTWPARLLCLLLVLDSTPLVRAQSWPYNLPKHQRYYPEHETSIRNWTGHNELVQKRLEVEERMLIEAPVAVKQFKGDPDEMFFPEYWVFAGDPLLATDNVKLPGFDLTAPSVRRPTAETVHFEEIRRNDTLQSPVLPPFLHHSDEALNASLSSSSNPALKKRAFSCPSGTNSCTAINRPDSCCGTNESCMLVADTGLGDVGCCPNGQSCAGNITQCDTAHGYHSCPGSTNGGCCIPGFACQGVGCIYNTTTTTQVLVTVTVNATNAGLQTSTSLIVLTPSTTYVTVTGPATAPSETPAPTDIVSVAAQGGMNCTSGFHSCPQSLGGGCCPNDRACGTQGLCAPVVTVTIYQTTTVASGVNPAVRPTNSPTTITSANICPSSYYQCSAFYVGGCCQVGRDCASTNCPSRYTETVEPGSIVVVVPTVVESGDQLTTQATTQASIVVAGTGGGGAVVSAADVTTTLPAGGSCQAGWFGCGAPQGGGCCPTGYTCGASCTATAGVGPSKVAKAAPIGSASGTRAPGSSVVALVALIAGLVGMSYI